MKDIPETTPALPTITGIPHPVNSLLVSGRAGQGGRAGTAGEGCSGQGKGKGHGTAGQEELCKKALIILRDSAVERTHLRSSYSLDTTIRPYANRAGRHLSAV